MAKYTHTAAFAHFGTKPTNVQWSWSARNEATKVVVATFWQDQFSRENGRLVYARPGLEPGHTNAPLGLRELVDNLSWARDHCDGQFKVIMAIAKDVNARPGSIKECFPSKMTMRLVSPDPVSAAFRAEALGL
jgi:hypothetical protein